MKGHDEDFESSHKRSTTSTVLVCIRVKIVKRFFRYLKGHPKLGLWYPKESPFDLVAYSDSDYGGATQDMKSTTGGCQFLGKRLISWQCKKQTIMATFTIEAENLAAASGCGQVLLIQNQLLDYGLAFCDYHNMIAILEKLEHNVDFHQTVDFVKASHIRYALTINPTLYVSHIQQFWSIARIETTNEGTKILATVDGKPMTISESSIRRYLKLNDEEGISSLPDVELFENLALTGYNILPNQKFTFQKGQFSHQWKFIIHTIMQCLSPKSTIFYEFSSNIATAVGEGSGTPTKPHHTPSPQAQQSPHHDPSSPLHLTATTESIPTATPTEIPTLRQYFRRATRISQSKALPTAADEPASLLRDDSQGEAFPTVSGLDAGQDRENIIKTSALPPESTPRMATKIKAQDLEISGLKARIKLLEDKDKGSAELSGDDALIKGRSMEIGEEAGVEKSTERRSNNTKELVNVLTSMDAANILTSGVQAVSVPPVTEVSTVGVPTVSGLVPTVSVIFTTASVVTPYLRRPKEILAKEKVAREMEEEMPREDQRMNEQIARDAKIARIHAKEELKIMIDGLDRSNEVIAKHLHEYEQAVADLTIGEEIELINELEQREFYMSILRSHAGWKTKHFRGMTLEEIREKFIPVWKQLEDFVLMTLIEEGKRMKRKGLKLDEGSAKKIKTSKDVSKEDLKGMMQLVPVEETRRAHNSLPILCGYAKTAGQRRSKSAIGFSERNSRTTNLRNEISNFQQRFDESFHEAWDRYKDLLRACPHYGFTELHQLDTFYNGLNSADQDSLNAAAGGNLLERSTQDVLMIIENKSKVRNSRNKAVVSQVKSCDANSNSSSEIAKLTHAVNQQTSAVTTAMTAILKQFQASLPTASVKAVEEICVTCGGSLPSNTVANLKGKLKAITTQSGLVLDGPTVPTLLPFINPEEDERVEETLTDPDLSEYTIKVPPPPLHINITLADALILMPKYQKMLKALLSNKEKLQEQANTPLNENCSAVILKKLLEKLGDPGKFLISCGFSELKCKALADLGASINLMPLSVWKKLGLPKLISTRMTLKLANRAIYTPARIARDVFVPVSEFIFPADFFIFDYKSDPRVPFILGRPFLRTARALIDVHGEEMILRDGDDRLTLNMRHDTSSYSNQPQKESINLINVFNDSSKYFLEDIFSTNQPSGNLTFLSHPELTSPEVQNDIFDLEGGNVLPEKLLDLDYTKDLHPPLHVNPLSGSTTYSSSPNPFLEELTDELALITFPPKYDDDLYNLANSADKFVYSMPEMFTDEHALDYSSPLIFNEYDDDLFEVESDTENVYDDPFDSKGEKIKYELKCKALANLGASINLMPLSVWKKLGLPELITTRMTLELANHAICTPAGIARDVFVPVGKFTFQADFVIIDYESDPRVPLILGRPFLRTARALIDVHGEEMILRDGTGYLPSNTVANPKDKLKAITTRSGLVIDGPTVPTPPQSINLEVDDRVEETFTDPDLAEYTIKVPPPSIQKYKPPSQR
nr:reverse transcriptase domain-containing protein [Tanacetum cinerariifolium]